MKTKTFLLIITAALLTGWGTTATITASLQGKRAKELKTQTTEQHKIIDSLLTIPRTLFSVDLHVSDNSKTTLNARKQSGEIHFPNTKVYELKIDSVTIKKITQTDKQQ